MSRILSKNEDIEIVGQDKTISDAVRRLKYFYGGIDSILLIDQGVNSSGTGFPELLDSVKELLAGTLIGIQFKFITREFQYEKAFREIFGSQGRFKAYYIDSIKIPVSQLADICRESLDGCRDVSMPLKKADMSIKKRRILPDFIRNSTSSKNQSGNSNKNSAGHLSEVKDGLTYSNRPFLIRGNLNRVIAVTGHRGSGVTSTAANLAAGAGMQGLKTIVIDLDTAYRGINLYFRKFGDEADLNPELASSLVKCLLKPDSHSINSCRINENLFVVTLAYSIGIQDKLIDFISIKRILNFITALKGNFNFIILDMPFSCFKEYPELLIHMDSIGLCVNNSLYSIINSVSCINHSIEREDLAVFYMKAKLIVTKYNECNKHKGKKLTPGFTGDILCEIGELSDTKLDCAGIIPYSEEFDLQVETGKRICSTDEGYKNHYLNILKNLL